MGESTKTSTQDNQPWAPAQPYLKDVMGESQRLYQSGAGSQIFDGNRVANFSPESGEALNRTLDVARGADYSGAMNYAGSVIGANGLSSSMARPLSQLSGIASGANGINTGGLYGRMVGAAGNQNAGANGVMGAAAGGGMNVGTGQFDSLGAQAGTQNNGVNGMLGSIAGGQAQAGNYAGGMNAGAMSMLSGIGQGPLASSSLGGIAAQGGITAGGQLQGLYGATQGQNNGSLGALGGVMNGSNGITTGSQYQDVANRAGGTTAADSLGGMLTPEGNVNPFLQQMLDLNMGKANTMAKSTAAGLGRYGSGSMAQLQGKAMADATLPIIAQAYESDQGRRLQAAGLMDASRQAAYGTELAALGGQTGTQQQNIANQMGAATSAAGIRQGDTQIGAGLLGQMGSMQNQNAANRMAATGQMDSSQRAQEQSRMGASGLLGDLTNAQLQGQLAGYSGAANTAQGLASSNRADWANQMGAAQAGAGVQADNYGRQIGAAGALADSNRSDLAQSMAAIQGLTGVQGQNIANQQQAANSQLGYLNQGMDRSTQMLGMMPQLDELLYSPANRIAGVGAANDAKAQQQIDAIMQTFNERQQSPWSQLAKYSGGVSGLSGILGNAGTSTGTTTQENNPLSSILGLGMAGLSLFSDRDSKTDIKKLGVDPVTGLDLYAYRYKDDPKTYPKVVGPMAQDVERASPGSTRRIGGLLTIKG